MPHTAIRRYLRHGTLRQLAAFETVASLGSFTRAAEWLYMAQPTVSVQVKKLAEAAGLALFEQTRGGVRLTDAGRVLMQAAREIFATLCRAEEQLAELRRRAQEAQAPARDAQPHGASPIAR